MSQDFFFVTIIFLVIIFMIIIFAFIYVIISKKNTENTCSLSRNTCDIKRDNDEKNVIMINENPEYDYNSKERDVRVLYDPLYPPENRTDSVNYDIMRREISNRNFYVPTNNYRDNYRQVGYLSNRVGSESDSGGNVWKLMARQRADNNRSEFYIIPSNNYSDIKIFLTDDIVKGRRLRDIYDIPNEINFDTPLLSSSPYTFTELPKNDWNNFGYY